MKPQLTPKPLETAWWAWLEILLKARIPSCWVSFNRSCAERHVEGSNALAHAVGFALYMSENQPTVAYGKTIEDVIRNIYIEAYYAFEGPEILNAPHLIRVPKDVRRTATLVVATARKASRDALRSIESPATEDEVENGAFAILENLGINKVMEVATWATSSTRPITTFSDYEKQGWDSDLVACLAYELAYAKQHGSWWYKWKNGRKFAAELVKLSEDYS